MLWITDAFMKHGRMGRLDDHPDAERCSIFAKLALISIIIAMSRVSICDQFPYFCLQILNWVNF